MMLLCTLYNSAKNVFWLLIYINQMMASAGVEERLRQMHTESHLEIMEKT